jgi:WD40 repeat protein
MVNHAMTEDWNIKRILAHKQPIYALAKLSEEEFISGANDKQLKYWSMDKLIFSVEFESEIRSITTTGECIHEKQNTRMKNRIIAISFKDQNTVFFDVENKQVTWVFETDGTVWTSFFLDENTLICGDTNGIIYIARYNNKSIERIDTKIESIRSMTYKPKSNHLVAGSQTGDIVSLNLQTKQIVASRNLGLPVLQLTFSPSNEMLYASVGNGQIYEIDSDFMVISQYQSQNSKVRALITHPKHPYIFTGGDRGVFQIWDIENIQQSTASLQLGKYEIWNIILLESFTVVAADWAGDLFILKLAEFIEK